MSIHLAEAELRFPVVRAARDRRSRPAKTRTEDDDRTCRRQRRPRRRYHSTPFWILIGFTLYMML